MSDNKDNVLHSFVFCGGKKLLKRKSTFNERQCPWAEDTHWQPVSLPVNAHMGHRYVLPTHGVLGDRKTWLCASLCRQPLSLPSWACA